MKKTTKQKRGPVKSAKRKPKNKSKEVLLNLGCGVHLYSGFINVDKYFTLDQLEEGIRTKHGMCVNAIIEPGAKFVQADMRALPFKDNSVDYIECLEALEHLPFRDVEVALKEMYRVLKPGGKIALLVPDLDDMCLVWQERITGKVFDHNTFFTLVQMFYGNQVHEGESHRAAFTDVYLRGLMHACGFPPDKTDVVAYPHGAHPPKFRAAQWNPRNVFIIGMLLAEATK